MIEGGISEVILECRVEFFMNDQRGPVWTTKRLRIKTPFYIDNLGVIVNTIFLCPVCGQVWCRKWYEGYGHGEHPDHATWASVERACYEHGCGAPFEEDDWSYVATGTLDRQFMTFILLNWERFKNPYANAWTDRLFTRANFKYTSLSHYDSCSIHREAGDSSDAIARL